MTVLVQKRKFSYFWLAMIILPIVSALTTGIILLTSPSEAQEQIETPEAITPTPTPTPIPRFLQFNGTSVLNGTQPIIITEYIDPINNYGYADATEIRIKEIGIQAETNHLIYRIRLKESGKIIEERYATAREAKIYEEYRQKQSQRSDKINELSDLRTKSQDFNKLTSGQKDVLLKQLLDRVIELSEN